VAEPTALLSELAALAADAADTLSPPESAGVSESVTAVARRVFGAAACSIAVLDEDADELEYVAASGVGAEQIIGTRLPLGRGFAGWVAQSGQPVAVTDLRSKNDPRFARDVAESTNYVPDALMAVPIESGERVLGVLSVLDRDVTRAGVENDLELASAFAAQAAAAIVAVEAFRNIGGVLLRELARAAGEGTDLAEALAEPPAARPADAATRRYIALLADLRSAGPAEQRLALDIVESVLGYARRKGGLSRPPR
jgi:signal transduction protein with GAF and PtsI domain